MLNSLRGNIGGRADTALYLWTGGGADKRRIARAGAGKSGGYRVIVFFKSGERAFFIYGFAKSDRGSINKKELKALREDAKEALAMNDGLLQERLKSADRMREFDEMCLADEAPRVTVSAADVSRRPAPIAARSAK